MKSLAEMTPANFWRNPHDYVDRLPSTQRTWFNPEFYVGWEETALILAEMIERYVGKGESVVELGCGAGRNLKALQELGFTKLIGIEINQKSIDLGREVYGLEGVALICSPIEKVKLPHVDCIFTHGILMHLPPSSEFVFQRIASLARKAIITVENETTSDGMLRWGRNYQTIFEGFGWTQMDTLDMRSFDFKRNKDILRVFVRKL